MLAKKESPAKKYRRKVREEMANKGRIKRSYPQVRKVSTKLPKTQRA